MSKQLFGTDGIRELIGKSPLTVQALPRLGYAIAQWATEKNQTDPSILLAHDTRSSSHFIKSSLKSGLLLTHCKIFDALALPTPAACLLTRINKSFNCGIIITASHNPAQYNGLKIVDSQGSKIRRADQDRIIDLFEKVDLESLDHSHLGNDFRALNPGEPYIATLSKHFKDKFLHGKTIVLDCAHGSTSSLAPHVFRLFGANVIAINAKPNGNNINAQCGSLWPKELQEAVKLHKADAGFAFDGDGDRIIAVNRHGHIKNGDDILALLIDNPKFKIAPAVVGTTFSNEGLAEYLSCKGKNLIRADVGDQNVMEELKLHKLPLGGEPSGHIIMQDYLDSADGIFTALSLLDTIIKSSNWDMTSFIHYPQVIINIPIQQKKDINRSPITEILTKNHAEFPHGRFVIRYSGTEPVLRVLVEAPEKKDAETMVTKLANQLRIAIDHA